MLNLKENITEDVLSLDTVHVDSVEDLNHIKKTQDSKKTFFSDFFSDEVKENPALESRTKKHVSFKNKESFFSTYQLIKDKDESTLKKEEAVFNSFHFYPAINNFDKNIVILTYSEDLIFDLVKSKDRYALQVFERYSHDQNNIIVLETGVYYEIIDESSIIDKEYEESQAKLFYKDLLTDASRKKASDIHLTWLTDHVSIRYRLDGVLIKQPKSIDPKLGAALKNIFVNSSGASEYERNEIAGQFVEIVDNVKKEYRLSVGPTIQGNIIVIRIEHTINKDSRLEDLLYPPEAIVIMRRLFRHKHGLILVTGQTGSGKTTLLYTAAVERLYEDNVKIPQILTIEDPVEMIVDGMNQVQVNTKGEEENWITFTTAIKMFLRQNPDFIIVGEIRDTEVAMQAVSAAKTGHLTASTLHTNDVKSTFPRLRELGVSNANIEDALKGVISQGLYQKLCDNCKEEDIRDGKTYYKRNNEGCTECSSSSTPGCIGRVPVVEIAELNNSPMNYLAENFVAYYSLDQNIMYLLENGTIDFQEANRVIKISSGDSLSKRNFIINIWDKATKNKGISEHIIPYVQPIVNSNDYVIGYESFMRIKDENGNIIYPDEFLELVKTMDMYNKFSMFMLDQIIDKVKKIEKNIFWNIDEDNILDKDFIESLYFKLKENNVLNKVIIELKYKSCTEYIDFIKKCNELKILISLDHFEGNFNELLDIEREKLEIAYIKTPKEFISGYSFNEIWIDTYVNMCIKVNASLIINFIETNSMSTEIKNKYKRVAEGYQGYGIARPDNFNNFSM